jgi:hypothetical protein
VAPYPADGLDWLADTGQANIDDFTQLLTDPVARRRGMLKEREALLAASAEDLREAWDTLLSRPTAPS